MSNSQPKRPAQQKIDGFFAKRTCVADCDDSSEKSDSHPIVCSIHDVSGEVPVKSAVSEPQVESEVDTSVDSPN